jgi:hypothetical protein
MTDRFHTLTVVLDKDIRDDDAEALMNAIRMMKRVISVDGIVSDYDSHMAEERVRRELGEKLLAILYPNMYKSKGAVDPDI